MEKANPEKEDRHSKDKATMEVITPLDQKSAKLYLGENVNLFFDPKMNSVSLSPIIPVDKIDSLFELYNLNLTKNTLSDKIKTFVGEKNLKKSKAHSRSIEQMQKYRDRMQGINEHFIKDCLILSKANKDGAFIVADRITKTIFGDMIKYKYIKNEENKKKVLAYLKEKDDIYIESDLVQTDYEAKLNVNKKIIMKYIPEEYSKEIINNINEALIKDKNTKIQKKQRYEKYLKDMGGNRSLLRKKRKMTQEEFSRRLPYFNMLGKNDDSDNNEEEFFMNTEDLPINEILLGDLGIVDNHLKDFKYTPLKIFEMIRDSEKIRGVDFKIEYSQINDKNYSHNNEVTIFSQKLGIKVHGYGKSREEAENKCALNLLAILFKNKFRTFCELHEYFEHKNKKYLDIILTKEDENENDENINKYKRKNIENNNKIIDDNDDETQIININNEIDTSDIMNSDNNDNNENYQNNNNHISYISENSQNNNNHMSYISLSDSLDDSIIESNFENNIDKNNEYNNDKKSEENYFDFDNSTISDKEMSVINYSFSSDSSTDNKLLEELSKKNKSVNLEENFSSPIDLTKNEELFDENIIYI